MGEAQPLPGVLLDVPECLREGLGLCVGGCQRMRLQICQSAHITVCVVYLCGSHLFTLFPPCPVLSSPHLVFWGFPCSLPLFGPRTSEDQSFLFLSRHPYYCS
jgi:hypothetical protein